MTAPTQSSPSLRRELTLGGAIAIGLSSMIGAGLFSAFGPAAAAAGSALLVGLLIAFVVAACNATSTAQLAAQYPTSGGSYIYGRERLGEWWGFMAGWGFVVGKSASAAAMALTVAAYVAPAAWLKPVALAALVVMVALNLVGVTRTAQAARIIVALVLTGLAVVLVAAWLSTGPNAPTGFQAMFTGPGTRLSTASGWYGVLQSAGLLFFAFAGYARIATLGEEVRDPQRNIPRAIITTLLVVGAIYAIVALTLLAKLGAGGIAVSDAPLADAADAAGTVPWAAVLVRITAAIAALGALLAGIAGVTRTALAMARNHDLPPVLAAVYPKFGVPHIATIALGVVVALLILVGDVREVIGFSSAGVLTYYFVANLAAFTQQSENRRYPRWMQVLGMVLCALLVFTLPWQSLLGGIAMFGAGFLVRGIAELRRARNDASRGAQN
ncbi:APC family permease [Gulosibacter hominis]|uniref:APC family permease n=1 Tax=Gulosibacter hominis TaxID=2770504 RepID=UPI001E5D6BDE|nr:APC family permease [Gulosibacter hominis]